MNQNSAMTKQRGRFRVVQPWGRLKAIEATLISEHPSADAAFAAIDTLAERIARTGAPSDAIELMVVDDASRIVLRRVS